MSCKQGYAFSCIMRGFLALEYGEIMNEMPEARKTAEEYFKKGCAMRDPRGNPFMNPRSCQYRKLALAKLAEAPSDTAAPGERAAPQDTGVNHILNICCKVITGATALL